MPIYEYQCKKCDHSFETILFTDEGEQIKCPKCHGNDVKKLVSCTSFIGASGLAGCAPGSGKGFS